MIIIKSKKSFLFSTCVILIGIAIFTCPVLGGLGGLRRPTDYFVYKGIHVSGDLDSLQYADGDSMYLKGKDYFIGTLFWVILIFAWQLGIYVEFDPYYYVGEGNGVTIKFMYSGPGPLHIYISYYEGGSDVYYESSTGGDYVTKTYYSDDYKSVKWVEFWASQEDLYAPLPAHQQHLYIDSVAVVYGQF